MAPEVTTDRPRFEPDSDLPAAHLASLQRLEASIYADPGRLLEVCNTLPNDPTYEQRQAEPLIDLILLATDEDAGLYFDDATEGVIAAERAKQNHAQNDISNFGAQQKNEVHYDGQQMRRARLEIFIGQVIKIKPSLQTVEADVQPDTPPLDNIGKSETIGKSDSAAA
jgi:hypothetical protein